MEIKDLIDAAFWEGGKNADKKSPEYLQKMLNIDREINRKYADLLSKESNLFSRFFLKVQKGIEIIKRKREVGCNRNLYLSGI